jgi:hypothetical protein
MDKIDIIKQILREIKMMEEHIYLLKQQIRLKMERIIKIDEELKND